MKQVIQNFKTGKLYVDEVPAPSLNEGMVLVENHFSLISAGTEKSTVKVAQSNLLGKARQRPDLVAQVIQNIRKEGLAATLEKVRSKLDSLKALGYSTAGVVVASLDGESRFKAGDRVACAGQDYASHAELVTVPKNLVVKIPDNVSMEEASFTTLGAIALQGIRQAEPVLGDNVCVIGLGLLGQLTCQMLRAQGCRVFGIDVSAKMVDIARRISGVQAAERNHAALRSELDQFTRGFGFDSVIITAAAPTNDPIELSAEILRKKGRVVVVGAVKMDVPRDPHFYRKELELRMSCSYGPGRYDAAYEEQGIDYPYAYVRWTEQRNMEAFLDLLDAGLLNIKPLITHVFDIADAEQAYDIVMGRVQEPFIGLLLKYEDNEGKHQRSVAAAREAAPPAAVQAAFIGAGSFAQSYLIPNVKGNQAVLDTVVTNNGITARNVADKFGFQTAATDAQAVLANKNINTVFIASRHDSHGRYVIDAIRAGKHIFVEKPLCLTYGELEQIKDLYEAHQPKLMVGFNRRFSAVATRLKQEFSGSEPKVINIRVNAGFIPREHWIQQPQIGGGRILGEVCHFVDLAQYFAGGRPLSVFATSIQAGSDKLKNDDNVVINITFSDGSVASIVYVANGDKAMEKERIEVFSAGKSGVINDFRSGDVFQKGNRTHLKLSGKGHKEEVDAFLKSITTSSYDTGLSFASIYDTTLVTLKILDSLATGMVQTL